MYDHEGFQRFCFLEGAEFVESILQSEMEKHKAKIESIEAEKEKEAIELLNWVGDKGMFKVKEKWTNPKSRIFNSTAELKEIFNKERQEKKL